MLEFKDDYFDEFDMTLEEMQSDLSQSILIICDNFDRPMSRGISKLNRNLWDKLRHLLILKTLE